MWADGGRWATNRPASAANSKILLRIGTLGSACQEQLYALVVDLVQARNEPRAVVAAVFGAASKRIGSLGSTAFARPCGALEGEEACSQVLREVPSGPCLVPRLRRPLRRLRAVRCFTAPQTGLPGCAVRRQLGRWARALERRLIRLLRATRLRLPKLAGMSCTRLTRRGDSVEPATHSWQEK